MWRYKFGGWRRGVGGTGRDKSAARSQAPSVAERLSPLHPVATGRKTSSLLTWTHLAQSTLPTPQAPACPSRSSSTCLGPCPSLRNKQPELPQPLFPGAPCLTTPTPTGDPLGRHVGTQHHLQIAMGKLLQVQDGLPCVGCLSVIRGWAGHSHQGSQALAQPRPAEWGFVPPQRAEVRGCPAQTQQRACPSPSAVGEVSPRQPLLGLSSCFHPASAHLC